MHHKKNRFTLFFKNHVNISSQYPDSFYLLKQTAVPSSATRKHSEIQPITPPPIT